MKTLRNTLALEISDVAAFRSRVLSHYYRYGLHSALDAFGVRKSTLYDWRKAFEGSGKRVSALIPHSTRPHQTRRMTTDWRLVEFIKAFRKTYGNVGKHKLKVYLDAYAQELGIAPLGPTTIGKIVKRRHLFEFPKKLGRQRRFPYARTNKSPKATVAGYIEVDSIVLYVGSKKHTFVCVIDIYTKYALAREVSNLSSSKAVAVLQSFLEQYPHRVHTVQTDNGSEFLKDFHYYLERKGIKHQFIYPRCPRVNGVIERFNRTVQEECLYRVVGTHSYDEGFNGTLRKYLEWYNTKRPHASLNYQTPVAFIQSQIPKCM